MAMVHENLDTHLSIFLSKIRIESTEGFAVSVEY